MKLYLELALAIILIVAVLAGCNVIPGYAPYIDESFDVPPLSFNSITVHAGAGDRIEGYFTIDGGQREVKFWIEVSSGVKVYDAGLVHDRHDFQVTCTGEDDYKLYFDNNISSTAGKNIYIRYRVRSI